MTTMIALCVLEVLFVVFVVVGAIQIVRTTTTWFCWKLLLHAIDALKGENFDVKIEEEEKGWKFYTIRLSTRCTIRYSVFRGDFDSLVVKEVSAENENIASIYIKSILSRWGDIKERGSSQEKDIPRFVWHIVERLFIELRKRFHPTAPRTFPRWRRCAVWDFPRDRELRDETPTTAEKIGMVVKRGGPYTLASKELLGEDLYGPLYAISYERDGKFFHGRALGEPILEIGDRFSVYRATIPFSDGGPPAIQTVMVRVA